jgi:hypothetical protein
LSSFALRVEHRRFGLPINSVSCPTQHMEIHAAEAMEKIGKKAIN